MTETKKVKLAYRAVEARIKRTLASLNQKLKKKGEKYTIVDCEKNSIIETYHDITILAHSLRCLKEYEEIDIDIKPVYAVAVAVAAAKAAKRELESLLDLDFVFGDYKWEEELDDNLHNVILTFLEKNKSADNFPKNINLILDEEAHIKQADFLELQIRNMIIEAAAKVKSSE